MTSQEKYNIIKKIADAIVHKTDFFYTYYNPKAEVVIISIPESFLIEEQKKLEESLLTEAKIKKVRFLVEEFPEKNTGFHLISKGYKLDGDKTTTTLDPLMEERKLKLGPIRTKFPCGNFRANSDNPTSIIGTRLNGSYYEIICPIDLRDNILYLLKQVNTLLNE